MKKVNWSKTNPQEVIFSGDSVVDEFLQESNAIESETSPEAFEDAQKAWDQAMTIDRMYPKDILEIHRILMKRVYPEIAGTLRDCDVFIGGERKTFYSKEMLEHMLLNFCVHLRLPPKRESTDEYTDEGWAKRMHIVFEGIHPFVDSNGRTGRILYNWHRLKLGLPIHTIHADWGVKGKEGEQASYYSWFAKKKAKREKKFYE